MASFSSRLRELRKDRNLRQMDLANALGMAQTTIANYEQSSRFPDEPTLLRIADFFDTSLDFLLGRTDINIAHPIQTVRRSDKPPVSEGDLLSPLAKRYLEYLLDGKRAEAVDLILNEARAGRSVPDIYLNVFEPTLKELGRLWSKKEVDVAQEHFFSAITEQIMSRISPLSPRAPKR
jgi:transcriptional regulator with XRE-family HTH domain